MYHPTIQKLDAVASEFHEMGMQRLCNGSFLLAGQLQQSLLQKSPHKTHRRFLHVQWVWALGHIGLLYQLIRWFRKKERQTQLVLVAQGSANNYFLESLLPFISMVHELPKELEDEAMHNAVYFGCPDGIHSLVSFYKMIEQECRDEKHLELSISQIMRAESLLQDMGIERPFVALHARSSLNDPKRNVTSAQIEEALEPYLAKGYRVVSTGIDPHPVNARFASVLDLPDPQLASFLLSATCNQFIGSNSGAWTVAHAFGRPVEILNDYERNAWIYP